MSHKSKIESTSSNGDTLTFQVSPSLRGIQNDRSNCWANAILQAICATPIVVILEEGLTEQSTSADNLIKTLVAFFHEMSSTTNAETAFQSTVIDNITAAVDMMPRKLQHCDAGEFYQLLVQNIIEQSLELFSNTGYR